MILLLFILLSCLFYAIIKAISDSLKWRKAEKEERKLFEILEIEEREKEEIERLLKQDKLNAYNAQLESYNQTIEWLNREEKNEKDGLKAALLRKKQSDIAIKAANIAQKAYKLELELEDG